MQSLNATNRKEEFFSLRTAYEAAFRELAAEARALQFLMATPDTNQQALAAAYSRAEKARKGYRDRRDRLMVWLLHSPEHPAQIKLSAYVQSPTLESLNSAIEEKGNRSSRFVTCCGR
jgi:hypothetical protein